MCVCVFDRVQWTDLFRICSVLLFLKLRWDKKKFIFKSIFGMDFYFCQKRKEYLRLLFLCIHGDHFKCYHIQIVWLHVSLLQNDKIVSILSEIKKNYSKSVIFFFFFFLKRMRMFHQIQFQCRWNQNVWTFSISKSKFI